MRNKKSDTTSSTRSQHSSSTQQPGAFQSRHPAVAYYGEEDGPGVDNNRSVDEDGVNREEEKEEEIDPTSTTPAPAPLNAELVQEDQDVAAAKDEAIQQFLSTVGCREAEVLNVDCTTSSDDHKRKREKIFMAAFLAILLIAGIVMASVIVGNQSGKNDQASRDYQVFTSTQDLRDAVDDYVFGSNSELSVAALTYGYPIGRWNVGKIADFSRLFTPHRDLPLYDPTTDAEPTLLIHFNEDLSDWDVSAATNMSAMFFKSYAFNRDISRWEVSGVTDMSGMFFDASSFDGNIAGWDVGQVSNMTDMFNGASVFNGDLSSWNVTSVIDMRFMFERTDKFNGDLSTWNVSQVLDMRWMFDGAKTFNADLSQWDVSKVKNMSRMFDGANAFTGIGVSNWDTSRVEDMGRMFDGADNFNADISSWDTGNVRVFFRMFDGADGFNGNLSRWNVSSGTNFFRMFDGADGFEGGNLSSWDTSRATNMRRMFCGAMFDGDVSGWDVSKVTSMANMFDGTPFSGDVSAWNVSQVRDLTEMFYEANSFNHNLCSWRMLLPLEAKVKSMFEDSACGVTTNPLLPDGPSMCQLCM